jgi:hypothetical protein
VNQVFLQLAPLDLLDHKEKREKKVFLVLLENLVFQGTKVRMTESPL